MNTDTQIRASDALRRPQSKNKVCSDRESMEQFLSDRPTAHSTIVAAIKEAGISSATPPAAT